MLYMHIYLHIYISKLYCSYIDDIDIDIFKEKANAHNTCLFLSHRYLSSLKPKCRANKKAI